jgi:hypothetical protein
MLVAIDDVVAAIAWSDLCISLVIIWTLATSGYMSLLVLGCL